jgi:FkbM family methyltransferase
MYFYNGIAILENDTHISKWVVENKRLDFDQNVLPILLRYINEGDYVLDAGANIGCYSYAFLNKISKRGMLYAFEPSIDTFECLEYNLGEYRNVRLYNEALSYKQGYCKVIEENDNKGMNFCEEVKDKGISVRTIDSLNLRKIDFIKIDVEGDELNVLIGAYDTIKKFKPTLYIEINKHTLERKGLNKLDIFTWLDKNGYTYSNIYAEQGFNDLQFDIIAIHYEKL